jgi:hypothetical protein
MGPAISFGASLERSCVVGVTGFSNRVSFSSSNCHRRDNAGDYGHGDAIGSPIGRS